MKREIKFAKGKVSFELPNQNFMLEMMPKTMETCLKGADEVKRAIVNPIGTKQLKDIVSSGETVMIVTSDITRPMPSMIVLPVVINTLKEAGITESDITVCLALGSHRSHSEEEKRYLVGDSVYESKVTILDSDVNNCINLGECNNGTPVDIFRPVYEADRVICLGNIEYHYFAGYSGGAKAIMPGVSSWNAIQANHSNMVKPEAKAGDLDTNPVRQDIEQITDFFKIDFIVNVILDASKQIVKAVAGHHKLAHREGCKYLDDMYGIKIDQLADIVIVTPGGYPKDLNLYQSQKALDNSKHAVKEGGIIILVASAKEGFGEHSFKSWMLEKTPDEMIEEIKINFKLGGHKAAAIAMILKKAQIFMVTDLDESTVKTINFKPFKSVQAALNQAIEEQGEDAKVILMPAGGSTLPLIG